MFFALFCVLWLLMLYEGSWLMAVGVIIAIAFAVFVDRYTMHRMIFPEEEQDVFYDADSETSSVVFYDTNDTTSEIDCRLSDHDTEDSESIAAHINGWRTYCRLKDKYPEDLLEKYLIDCLDESGFIRIENVKWISGKLAPQPEAKSLEIAKQSEEQTVENEEQSAENEEQSVENEEQSVESEEPPVETTAKPLTKKQKFKRCLKKFFCCFCDVCGKKD